MQFIVKAYPAGVARGQDGAAAHVDAHMSYLYCIIYYLYYLYCIIYPIGVARGQDGAAAHVDAAADVEGRRVEPGGLPPPPLVGARRLIYIYIYVYI